MRKMKKAVSSLLVCAMVCMSLAGCGQSRTQEEQKSATGEGAPAASKEESAAAGVSYDEKIKVVIGGFILPVNNEFGKLNDPVTQMLNEKFNVEIEVIDGGDNSDWTTRLSALIAANDIPDVVEVLDPKPFDMMLSANQILDLTPYITEDITPNLVSDPKYTASQKIESSVRGGKVYGIGMCRGTWDSGNSATVGDFIRWDLYKELGYPKLENYDDLLNVLKEMQDKYPVNSDGKKCYAVGAWFGDGMGWADWPMTYARAYAGQSSYISDPLLAVDKKSGQIIESNQIKDVTSPYWQMMEFYNKAYRMGLLDPESFTQKYDVFDEKLREGRYFYLNPGWFPGDLNNYYAKELGLPDMGFAMVAGLNGDSQTLTNQMVKGERMVAVSSKTKDPARVMALLDYISSYEFSRIAVNGVQGEYWDIVDGKASVKPELYDGSVKGDVLAETAGVGIYGHFMGYADGTIEPATGLPVKLSFIPEIVNLNLSNVEKDQLEHFGASSMNELFTKQIVNTSDYSAYQIPPLSTEMQTDFTNFSDYKFKNTFKIIMAESEDGFVQMREQFITDIDRYHVDAIYEYLLKEAREQEAIVKQAIEEYGK